MANEEDWNNLDNKNIEIANNASYNLERSGWSIWSDQPGYTIDTINKKLKSHGLKIETKENKDRIWYHIIEIANPSDLHIVKDTTAWVKADISPGMFSDEKCITIIDQFPISAMVENTSIKNNTVKCTFRIMENDLYMITINTCEGPLTAVVNKERLIFEKT